MANLSGPYCAYFGEATEVWKQHVIGITVVAFDEFRDSVCQTLENVAQTSSQSAPDGSAGGLDVNQEMFGNVQTAIENAQHLAQQRIADTLAQTFNAPPPIILSSISNQTIQANQLDESATSHVDARSDPNDSSLDISIKSEVDSSSECESDSENDEIQVKEEPNEEEENIISGLNENDNGADASSQEQTENTDNSGDHRENSYFQMGNSNEGPSGQEDEAMAIDEELVGGGNIEEDPNGPIIIVVQYASPPSSPLNAEQSDSFAGQQEASINLNEDIASGDEADLDAEDEGDGDFGEDERMDDNDYPDDLENQDSDPDEQDESDQEGALFGEETDGEDYDYSEGQENLSGAEDNEEDVDDSSEEINNEDTEEEEAPLSIVGPSTSAQKRQGTRRASKRQIGKASKRQRIERDVDTVPLRVVTKKLQCTVPGCKKVVKSKGAMNRHLLSKHQLKEYRCLVRPCHGKVSTSFSTQSQLTNHRDQVHGTLTEWTCKCSKQFNSYNDLSYHYWRYHELGHFTCSKDDCPVKSTTTRAKVADHQNNHREAKYHCPVDDCGSSFKKKSNLDRHLLTHSGERPFPCPECDKSFAQKETLTTHLRIHRNDKCFRCTWPQCTYSSSVRANVIKHIRTVHFKLPRSKLQQAAANIVDDRDARDFLAKN